MDQFPTVLHLAEYLGIQTYDWQAKICLDIDTASVAARQKFAVKAPNEAGKSSRIIALSVLRWLQRYPAGKVVITSKDSRQIADQVWPAVRSRLARFPGWKVTESEKRIDTPEGGRLRCFTTDDPGRAEGFHSAPGQPLFIIVDEAKSIDAEVLQAIDRCSYTVLLYISSPWLREGPFYGAFTINRALWHTYSAGLKDCPHIAPEKISDIVATYGENTSFTRSALHGEFADQVEGVNHIFELTELEKWLDSQIGIIHGPTVVACDFAAGGAMNVILKRVGNRVTDVITWRDRDTASATGRFIREIHRLGWDSHNKFMHVMGDATGVGRPMCDMIRESGIDIVPFNFGAPCNDKAYKDEGTRIWRQTAITLPTLVPVPRYQESAKQLIAQLSSRRAKDHSGGKMWMETKDEMASRGIPSPDIADAFCMAFGFTVPVVKSWMPYDDTERQEIAKKHGWDYTPSEDHGHPGRGEDNTGFGGVHSVW
jgi:hypothetical protein